jgi:abhydrolase domain-containing protein 6
VAALAAAGIAMAVMGGCRTVEEAIYDAGTAVVRSAAGFGVGRVETEIHGELAYFYREGSGPTIVLLHGFVAQKEMWLRMAGKIPEEYGILALDLPGHGNSDRVPGARYRAEDFVDAIEDALDGLNLEDFHLAGSSFGGMVAVRYALRHPGRVKSLGLFNPALLHPPETSDLEKRIAEGRNPIMVRDRSDFDRLTDMLFYETPFMPWPVARVLSRRAADDLEHRERMWVDVWENRDEIREELADLTAPVFLLWGRHDRFIDVSAAEVVRDYLGEGLLEYVILEDAGHSPMLENPEETARLYTDFLESVR